MILKLFRASNQMVSLPIALFSSFSLGQIVSNEQLNSHSFVASELSFPDVPKNLELKQLIVITRHGDRAPISKSLGSKLPVCDQRTKIWEDLLPKKKELEFRSHIHPVVKKSNENFQPKDVGREPYAQLTKKGMKEHEDLGKYLRQHVLKNGILPEILNSKLIYARSTNLKRTIQSAQSLLYGLYPPAHRASGKAGEVPVHVWPFEEEVMLPNPDRKCLRQSEIIAEFQRRGDLPQDLIESGFESECREVLGLNGRIIWAQVREVLLCHLVHQLPMPQGVSPSFIEKACRASMKVWSNWYQHPEFNRLAIGRFLDEICIKMKECCTSSVNERVLLYSGHDNSLVPILCALGCFDDQLPPYSALVCLELAKDILTGQHYVRATYNNIEMKMFGEKQSWLPFETFLGKLKHFIPTDYDKECLCSNHFIQIQQPGGDVRKDDEVLASL